MNLDEVYQMIEKERGGLATIHTSFHEFPAGIAAHYELYKALILSEGLPLERSHREFLATEVSRANECLYCIAHHEEALKNSEPDIASDQERALKEIAEVLTKEPMKASGLRKKFLSAGF